jgi:hypothetical protein
MKHHQKDLLGLGIFLVLLFIGWVIVGGPGNAKQSGDAYNKFQKPLSPIDSGGTYNKLPGSITQ